MTEILFYHLERKPLERVLPELLEKCLERSWRSVVQAPAEERIEALNTQLWTYRDESFLPHGTSTDGAPERQPIYLTTGADNPNNASVCFLIDGAEIADPSAYTRVVYLFDGGDEEAVARARTQWVVAKDGGHDTTYWQQNDHGRWEKKA